MKPLSNPEVPSGLRNTGISRHDVMVFYRHLKDAATERLPWTVRISTGPRRKSDRDADRYFFLVTNTLLSILKLNFFLVLQTTTFQWLFSKASIEKIFLFFFFFIKCISLYIFVKNILSRFYGAFADHGKMFIKTRMFTNNTRASVFIHTIYSQNK